MIKILYVEDEPFLGKIVKESLESRDFQVHMVTDGARVMAALEKASPDICVLDVMLPHRDGFSLAEEIRQSRPELPILFLTAKDQTADVLKGFAAGGNDYVRKPFSMEELIVRIQNLVSLAGGQQPAGRNPQEGIQIGRYEFFPLKYELRYLPDNSARKLSARETELLQILAGHRNFTVSRKEILLKVWGDDHFFNSRNLDVYITKIREYLRLDPDIQIVTIKGVGYHFVVG